MSKCEIHLKTHTKNKILSSLNHVQPTSPLRSDLTRREKNEMQKMFNSPRRMYTNEIHKVIHGELGTMAHLSQLTGGARNILGLLRPADIWCLRPSLHADPALHPHKSEGPSESVMYGIHILHISTLACGLGCNPQPRPNTWES